MTNLLEKKKERIPLMYLAGLAGFEPTIEGSEPSALPLGYSPIRAFILKWQAQLDLNQRMRESKSLALPLGYGPTLYGAAEGN